jgi:ribonuclease HI
MGSAENNLKNFHIDGAGARPDGTGSGYAWVRIGTDKQRIKRVDGWTNNEAEYWALVSVLKYLAGGSRVRIYTDSQVVCQQFNGKWAVNDPKLIDLLSRAREFIENKSLDVEVVWIPRERNEAGKLLERNGRAHALGFGG